MDRPRRSVLASIAAAVAVLFGVGIACVLVLHDDVPAASLWVVAASAAVLAYLVRTRRSPSRRGRAMVSVAIALALVPWALAVHAVLPHDWLAEAEADLRSLDVAGLEYAGREDEQTSCIDGFDDVQHAYVARTYRLTGDEWWAVRDRVDERFAELGYAIDEPGSGRRGPLVYEWSATPARLVEVEVWIDRCGWSD